MKRMFTILSMFFLVSVLIAQQPDKQTPSDQQTTRTKTPAVIPVTEVPGRADKVHLTLNKIREELKPLPDIVVIEKELPQTLDSLKMLRSDSLYDQLSNLSPRTLQNLSQEWSLYLRTLNEWEKVLLSRSQVLERQKKLLQNMAVEWKITADSTKSEETPEAIRERIASIVIEIDTVETNLAERINTLLVLQNRISEQQIAINELISLINNTEAQLQTRLFVQDSPPLWEAFQAQDDTLHIGGKIGESWKNFSQTMIGFVRANKNNMYLHLILFAGLLAIMVYFYRRNKQQRLFDEGEEVLKASAFFISRPFSAALLIALFFSIWLYPDATVTMAELVIISFLIPLLRLMSGVVVKERRKAVYAMAMLYVFIFFHNNVVGHPLLQRLLLIAITIAAIGLFARLIRSVRPIQKQQLRPWPKLIFRLLPLGLLILLLSLAANIYGSVAFAYVITEGVIKSIINSIQTVISVNHIANKVAPIMKFH